MKHNIAIVGAGIIGMTNAVRLLQEGFSVTVFTKDNPLKTNSDAAVATWYTTDDSKPILQKYCLKSLTKFYELIEHDPACGIKKYPSSFILKKKKILKTVFGQRSLYKH